MHVDTSFLVALLRERRRGKAHEGAAHRLLASLPPYGVLSASVFVFCELELGVRLALRPETERAAVQTLRRGLRIVYPDESFPTWYAELYASLEGKGARVGVMDTAIAALARAEGEPLITSNAKHFERFQGLEIVTF